MSDRIGAGEIEAALKQRIRRGDWRAGEALPSQSAIAAEFGVTRHLVREALRQLREKNLIESVQGAPARVSAPHFAFPLTHRTRFTSAVRQMGLKGDAALISFRRRRPQALVVEALQMTRATPIWTAILLRHVDGQPFSLAWHYFAPMLKIKPPSFEGHVSVSRILEENGYPDYVRKKTMIACRLPSPREAAALRIRRNQPVLMNLGCNVSGEGMPLEISESIFPGSFVQFSVDH